MKLTHPTPDPSRAAVVAIVGRPNVGKSAIFNRISGRRIAIVHGQNRVTRDRLIREVEWDGVRFTLIDTGGLGNVGAGESRDPIEAGIMQQAGAALREAAVVIFVVDVETGIHPLDEDLAELLRRHAGRVYIAVNKCDNASRDLDAVEFEQLGFPASPVSALHNRGFDPLMQAVVEQLPRAPCAPTVATLKVAVVGRPNVGKSSYINRLLREERVIVSDIPGTTVDSVDIPFTVGEAPNAHHYLLTDTAGLRPPRRIRSSVDHFSGLRAERSVENADIVILILDAVQGPTAHDKRVAAMIAQHQKGCVLLVNKWDLAGKAVTQRQYEPALRAALPFLNHVPVLFVAAQTGYNIRKSMETINHVAAQIQRRLSTGALNRTITKACQKVQPPIIAGKRLRIYYATQTGAHPIRIALFVNDPKRLQPSYRTYLTNALRAEFGLEGAPIVFHLVPKKRQEGQSE